MANWCMTNMIIAGEKCELRKLRALILKWTSKEYVKNGFGEPWLGNIVLGAGFMIDDFECRGNVLSVGSIYDLDGLPYFEIEYESAWQPMPEMWYSVTDKYAPNCKVYWYAEEPGFELYQSNDIHHVFFSDTYAVDCYITDTENKFLKAGFENGITTYDEEGIEKILRKVYPRKLLYEMLVLAQKEMKNLEDNYLGIYAIDFVE